MGATTQPAQQHAPLLLACADAAQLHHPAHLAQAQCARSACLEYGPRLAGKLQTDLLRRKTFRCGFQRASALYMPPNPFCTAVEKSPGASFRHATRNDQLDHTIGSDAYCHPPRAQAVAHLRNRLRSRLAPQRQLRRGAFVGYPHATMITAASPELIDIGANLTHESFAADLPEVLCRASNAGVQRMIVTGTSVAATRAAIDLHAGHPTRLFATAGLHPHHAADLSAAVLDELRELADSPGVVAVGECGLDYYRNFAPRETQIAAFCALLEVAATTRKPVFLHQRDAHGDFISILREYRSALTDGVAHCFTGQASELEDCLDLNLAIGITGWICDERRGLHLLPLMPEIRADRLMIETDAPYLVPRSLRPQPRGRRNEPAFLTEVAAAVAHARGESFEQLARSSTGCARSFFRLP
jgi:TatD DNase family protein